MVGGGGHTSWWIAWRCGEGLRADAVQRQGEEGVRDDELRCGVERAYLWVDARRSTAVWDGRTSWCGSGVCELSLKVGYTLRCYIPFRGTSGKLKTEPILRNSAELTQFRNFRTEESLYSGQARRLKLSDNLAECRNSGCNLVPFVVATAVSSRSAILTMRFALYLPIHHLFH